MPRHSAPQQPSWLRPRLVVAFVVATAGLVTAVWLPTRNDSADAAVRPRGNDHRTDSRRDQSRPAFTDEFGGRRGSTVDPTKWVLRTNDAGSGLRFSQSTRHARLDGEGNLVLVLRGEDHDAFTSARLLTREVLRGESGHAQARIRTPEGKGLRPAFELVGAGRSAPGALNVLAAPVGDDEFHTYAVDWAPGEIVLSVDGERTDQVQPAALDTGQPFRLALSLTVDQDRDRADLPARMVVDSVSFTAAGASTQPTAPPSTEPTATEPPATEPPATEPPASVPTTAPTSEAPTTEPPATTAPTTTPPTTPPTTTPPAATEWAPFTDYVAGQLVTYKGIEYQVQETHTSLPGWEPTALPALFKKV